MREVSRANLNAGDGWEKTVAEYAQYNGWKVAHFRRAQTAKGWRTPVGFDGKGFVDFVMARERIVYCECKTGSGRLTKEQREWRDAIVAAGGEWYLWKPSDWDEVQRVLGRL